MHWWRHDTGSAKAFRLPSLRRKGPAYTHHVCDMLHVLTCRVDMKKVNWPVRGHGRRV